jgi:hypothetical protein
MRSLRVVFGKNCADCCNVGLHFLLPITLRRMGLLSVFIVLSSRFYVAIVWVFRISGVSFWLSVSLH